MTRAAGDIVIAARHTALGYGSGVVLQGLEFQVPAGSRVGVLGPNGGGKTTLFRALQGEIAPVSGELSVGATVATVPQTDRSRLDYPVTALDVAVMGTLSTLPWWKRPGRSQRRRAEEALAMVGLDGLARHHFGSLSGGQRQRVLIARALTAQADILLMDEPFTGLDSPSEAMLEELIDRLGAEKKTVMIATHEVEQAARWDLVLCLNRTQISFGDPARAISRPVLEATYGGHIVEIPGQPDLGVLPAHHHDHGEDQR
jgi:ABC-type Mn2+/Zn2+ transport system ATPase subunit